MAPKEGVSKCNFSSSTVSEELLHDFVAYGVLPPKTVVQWRAPERERRPDPHPGEHIFFTSWLNRGFTPPGSKFLREVLHFFYLHPQDISPNSLMYIAMHTTLCEGYLCIKPSLPLFRYLFQCKERDRFVQCGAITFQRRPGVEFPTPHFHKKIEDWQKSYFYCKSVVPEGQLDFLPFSESRFSPSERFISAKVPLTEEELQSIRPLREKLMVDRKSVV